MIPQMRVFCFETLSDRQAQNGATAQIAFWPAFGKRMQQAFVSWGKADGAVFGEMRAWLHARQHRAVHSIRAAKHLLFPVSRFHVSG